MARPTYRSILVVIRHSPLNTGRDEEGLRMAVGLTITNPEVSVLLLDKAVWLARPLDPTVVARSDLARHWQTLGELGLRRLVERESLAAYGIEESDTAPGVEVISRAEAADLLLAAEAVVVY